MTGYTANCVPHAKINSFFFINYLKLKYYFLYTSQRCRHCLPLDRQRLFTLQGDFPLFPGIIF
jgi:hypothetical protein